MATSRQKQLASLHWRRQREQCFWQNKVEGVPEHFPTNLSARAPLSLILFCVLLLGWIMILVLHVSFYPPSLLKYFIHASPAIQPWCWTLALGFDLSSPSISTQGALTTKTCISNTLLLLRSEHIFLPDPTSPPCWLTDLWFFFLLFYPWCRTSLKLFFHSQVLTSPLETKKSHSIQSQSWSYKHSCPVISSLPALLPSLHNWSSSTQDQDPDHYFTVHWLISIFSSNFFFLSLHILSLVPLPFPCVHLSTVLFSSKHCLKFNSPISTPLF